MVKSRGNTNTLYDIAVDIRNNIDTLLGSLYKHVKGIEEFSKTHSNYKDIEKLGFAKWNNATDDFDLFPIGQKYVESDYEKKEDIKRLQIILYCPEDVYVYLFWVLLFILNKYKNIKRDKFEKILNINIDKIDSILSGRVDVLENLDQITESYPEQTSHFTYVANYLENTGLIRKIKKGNAIKALEIRKEHQKYIDRLLRMYPRINRVKNDELYLEIYRSENLSKLNRFIS